MLTEGRCVVLNSHNALLCCLLWAMRGYVGACWTRVALNFRALCSSHHVVSVWRKSPDSLCSAVGPLTWWSVGPCCSLWASSWPWCSTYCRCRETSPSFPLMSSAVSSPRPGGCRPAAARPQVCEDTQHTTQVKCGKHWMDVFVGGRGSERGPTAPKIVKLICDQ